ncbi:MAG: sodium/calcium exchanger protein [Pirellulaceae bacterium]|nr:sodium/calcium exchanger protein [Pirellulaceae bacterium]
MLVVSLEFLVLAVVVALAGTFLAKSADQIAEITRLGRLLIGSVLLAAATSLPELTVDISAVRQGMPDLAVGDLFGSSLMNLLILAALDLAHRSGGKMLSRELGRARTLCHIKHRPYCNRDHGDPNGTAATRVLVPWNWNLVLGNPRSVPPRHPDDLPRPTSVRARSGRR